MIYDDNAPNIMCVLTALGKNMFMDTFSVDPSNILASLAPNILVSCFSYPLACP